MKVEKYLTRWRNAGIVDSVTASRILEFESKCSGFGFGNMLIRMAGLAIFLGIAAVIGSNWDQIPASLKISTHTILNVAVAVFLFRHIQLKREKTVWFDFFVALLAGLTLTFIALIGQIYQTQEPTWKALTFWLVLTTPFWLGLGEGRKHVVRLWVLAFLVTYAFFAFDGPTKDLQARALLVTLLPFGMIALGQSKHLRKLSELTFEQISFAGFILVVVGTSAAQIVWRDHELTQANEISIAWRTATAAFVAVLAIVFARYRKGLVSMPADIDVLLISSVFICAAPFLIPHNDWSALGAGIVMIYWAFCGWAGSRAGYPRAINIASIFIALRLVVVYIEIFGSLLQTGVGLIVSGLLLIALVVGTRRAMGLFGQVK